MDNKVELFSHTYKNYSDQLYEEIREEMYGEDIGQTSWMTADEYRSYFKILNLSSNHRVLDVAVGSGGPAVFMVKETGCHLVGLDINEDGIKNAKTLADKNGVGAKMDFILADASDKLPFSDSTFDTIISIDSINHFKNRDQVFLEFKRILKKGGRLLFTDAVVITGILTSEEIAIRSSLGYFVFIPKGENEKLLKEAGFSEIQVADANENLISTSNKWYHARKKRKEKLLEFESEKKFNQLQSFFEITYKVSSEKRLSRFMYTAAKPH